MHYKIEPSGCCEVKGLMQIRFCLYLEAGDYGYEKHHITVPVFPKEGYPGKMDVNGTPIDIKDYEKWVKGLPTQEQDNPFHNHFAYVPQEITDDGLHALGKQIIQDAMERWEKNETPDVKTNMPQFDNTPNNSKSVLIEARIADIKTKQISGIVEKIKAIK